MMKIIEETPEIVKLEAEGDLTANYARETKKILSEAKGKLKDLSIVYKKEYKIDLTHIQMILSIKKATISNKKKFFLSGDVDLLKTYFEKAGIIWDTTILLNS